MKVYRVFYFGLIIATPFLLGCNKQADTQKKSADCKPEPVPLKTMLNDWAENYQPKVENNYHAIINFKTHNGTGYSLEIKPKTYQIADSISEDAHLTFKASPEHYNKIYHGEMTAFTSIGRENMSDSTPLGIEPHRAITDNIMNDLLFFVQHFFTKTSNGKIILEKERARVVHGAYAIPIFYQHANEIGVRSAWYQVEKNQQINKPGDTNPFPQYFIVIKGNGYAKLGNDTVKVKKNEAYYIPPGSDHVFWTDSDKMMQMIFLAWGKGA